MKIGRWEIKWWWKWMFCWERYSHKGHYADWYLDFGPFQIMRRAKKEKK